MADPKHVPQLRPVMGLADLALFFVIASLNLVWVIKAAEAGAAGITLWVIAGLVFYLPLAVCVLALAQRYPGEGGLYVWSREAFGEFAGFMTGWTYWACILPFLPIVLYFIAGSALYLAGGRWDHLAKNPTYYIVVSLACLLVATALNIVGLGVGKWLHNAGAVGVWLPALALTVLGFLAWALHGPATAFTAETFIPSRGIQDAVVWSFLVLGLTGLEAVPVLGDEINDARRRIPPALAWAAVLVMATNIVATFAVLAALAPGELIDPDADLSGSPGFMRAYSMAAQRSGVGGLVPLVAGLVVVGHIGKVGAWTATGARLPFVAGVGGRLPPVFARLHPRWGTPHVALWLQAAIVAILIVLGQAGTTTQGAYQVFQSMTLIPTFIPFFFLFAAAIRLCSGRVAAFAVLGLVSSLVTLAVSVVPPEDEKNPGLYVAKVVGLAVALVATGVGVYVTGGRRFAPFPRA